MDVFEDRFNRPFIINAGLSRILEGHEVQRSIGEVFDELVPRFHTIDMLEFLGRTRGWSDWVLDAYKVVNSDRVGYWNVSRKTDLKKRRGVIAFSKPSGSLEFRYLWGPGEGQALEDSKKVIKGLLLHFQGHPDLPNFDPRFLEEEFVQRMYSLESVDKVTSEDKDFSIFGNPIFSYKSKKKEELYPLQSIH